MKEAYFAVLDDVVRAGLRIRAEACTESWFPHLEADYSKAEKIIRVRRQRSRLMNPAHRFDRETLYREAVDLCREVCLIARELGYHHLTLEGLETMVIRGGAATDEGKRKLLVGEVSAWSWARTHLEKAHFPEMTRFEEVTQERLRALGERLALR